MLVYLATETYASMCLQPCMALHGPVAVRVSGGGDREYHGLGSIGGRDWRRSVSLPVYWNSALLAYGCESVARHICWRVEGSAWHGSVLEKDHALSAAGTSRASVASACMSRNHLASAIVLDHSYNRSFVAKMRGEAAIVALPSIGHHLAGGCANGDETAGSGFADAQNGLPGYKYQQQGRLGCELVSGWIDSYQSARLESEDGTCWSTSLPYKTR